MEPPSPLGQELDQAVRSGVRSTMMLMEMPDTAFQRKRIQRRMSADSFGVNVVRARRAWEWATQIRAVKCQARESRTKRY